ncbi:response regulator [Fulvivirga sp. RKSG066]|uniref:LytR/AlgR family response regulator transcription factor n=1 Tax=Fulvivirga aurantia TaxID=2529383 RepID=UPI0012BD0AB1|nr:LytTR family transcriptional regulator DNA-binding domain-containing protein [Fulvivirga aurantia]MTI22394.1 response regulator [Fulvivirga aurantia]
MIKTVIIDDEKLARDVIKAYLKKESNINIVAECANGFEGMKAIQEHEPDLIFLDIQMPKLTGFEMLEVLEHKPVIIFSTAYDEYAIKAFELNAADYLLKPYSESRFKEALKKATAKIEQSESGTAIEKIMQDHKEQQESLDRVVIRSGSKILIISIDKIDYFEAQDDYVAIHSEGNKYLKQLTMKWLTSVLPENEFVRVHRSFIVAVRMIDKLEAYSKDSFIAILKNGDKVSVSRSGYQQLKTVLNF